MLIFLVITLVLINTPPTLEIDPKMKPYVEEVKKLSKSNIKGIIPILVKPIKSTALATCHYTAIRYITVDPEKFEYYTEKEKTLILAQELMHCECSMSHDEKKLDDECPKSVMYPYMPFTWCVDNHWEEYVKEMQEVDC